MKLNPYLSFSGNCREAFKFYEQCLGGKNFEMMTYGASPMADQTPPEWHDKVMHAQITLDGQELMGADAPPEHFSKPRGVSVLLSIETLREAEWVFEALAEQGTVTMPLQKTFWAARFGMLNDQFGIPWMVNCSQSA